MKIISDIRSPNFDDKQIPVEFIVIHYTACSLDETLRIFKDSSRKVSSHLVIAADGSVYETVPCLSGMPLRAWHAGQSIFKLDSQTWESFNNFSLGIELENLNGNIFDYTEAQYSSLISIIEKSKMMYPQLIKPERIVGHEQIATERGKIDPGWRFDWERIFKACYPGASRPVRNPNLPAELLNTTDEYLKRLEPARKATPGFWADINQTMEKSTGIKRS